MQRRLYRWPYTGSWRSACRETFRCWQPATLVEKKKIGRKATSNEAVTAELVDTVLRLGQRASLSSTSIQGVLTVGRTRRLLHSPSISHTNDRPPPPRVAWAFSDTKRSNIVMFKQSVSVRQQSIKAHNKYRVRVGSGSSMRRQQTADSREQVVTSCQQSSSDTLAAGRRDQAAASRQQAVGSSEQAAAAVVSCQQSSSRRQLTADSREQVVAMTSCQQSGSDQLAPGRLDQAAASSEQAAGSRQQQ